MAIRIQCPQCKSRYLFNSVRAGKSVVRIKCPGCGHAFQVNLTDIKEHSPLPTDASSISVPVPKPAGKKILIVDDSLFFREMILDMLKSLGVQLFTAADGVEGLQLIRSEKPDLVLLDLNLPHKNGYELIKDVREDAQLSGVRLLAMSGVFRKNEEINEAYRGGADDFIGKSFKPEQLLERVNKLLEG